MQVEADETIETRRLSLRPVTYADAANVMALAGEWDVARMLADMPFPMSLDLARSWTETAVGDKSYAITFNGVMIGGLSVCAIEPVLSPETSELGFWLGKTWWGRGFAREAGAAALIRHRSRNASTAFSSGHFADNPASGRVLRALGFTQIGVVRQWCLARQETLPAIRFELGPQPRRAHWEQVDR